VSASVERIRQEEKELGLDDPETYRRFAENAETLGSNLTKLLHDLKGQGCSIAGYGAPAKAATLLNFCRIGRETLDYVIDSTAIKQGRYIPGTKILIRPPDVLKAERPDYLLLLAWNYADAILSQEKGLREQGVRFILPIPTPQVIE
jgi:hypothetical protein